MRNSSKLSISGIWEAQWARNILCLMACIKSLVRVSWNADMNETGLVFSCYFMAMLGRQIHQQIRRAHPRMPTSPEVHAEECEGVSTEAFYLY